MNDTSTNSIRYPTFVSATSGSMTTANVSSTKLYFNPSTGTLSATEFNSLSDERLKTDIKPIADAVSIVNSINGVSFKWKDTENKSIGVIAQEIENVLPELVDCGEYKTVNYNGIIGVLIEAIKELNKKIKEISTGINK